MTFFVLNIVEVIGLLLTFKPFLVLPADNIWKPGQFGQVPSCCRFKIFVQFNAQNSCVIQRYLSVYCYYLDQFNWRILWFLLLVTALFSFEQSPIAIESAPPHAGSFSSDAKHEMQISSQWSPVLDWLLPFWKTHLYQFINVLLTQIALYVPKLGWSNKRTKFYVFIHSIVSMFMIWFLS